jgi:hypothetical protein
MEEKKQLKLSYNPLKFLTRAPKKWYSGQTYWPPKELGMKTASLGPKDHPGMSRRRPLKGSPQPTRREFIRGAAGTSLMLAGSSVAAWADHHGHPTPQSLSYLDRRMYIRNMEILAHFMPEQSRNGKMQMMSIGNRRYLFQQGDVIDLSGVRKPVMYNKGGFQGGQIQVAFNKDLKKWILMTGSQTPITDSTPEAPNGKYDDPRLDDKRKNFKGLRGVRFYDVTDPSKIVKLSEFSTGATGQGTHRNYYDGGKYAYLDTAPDETFIHQPSYFRQLVNGNMIVDATDPSNVSQVSMWWVPGSRKGEEAEYNKWIWSKLVPPKVAKDQTPEKAMGGWSIRTAPAIFRDGHRLPHHLLRSSRPRICAHQRRNHQLRLQPDLSSQLDYRYSRRRAARPGGATSPTRPAAGGTLPRFLLQAWSLRRAQSASLEGAR